MGELEILSVGRGHLKLTITEGDKEEIAKAKRTIQDMLERGYAIFVEPEPGKPLERVKRFDAKHLEYIIEGPEPPSKRSEASRKGAATKRRIKATGAKATVVGRTAGG